MVLTSRARHVLQMRRRLGAGPLPGGRAEPIPKSRLSSDCTLQLGCMKVESLVIADQHAAVNTFPGLVHTARHTMGVGSTFSVCANLATGGSQPRSG